MGRKSYVTEVLESCVFARKNDDSGKVTLDLARQDSVSWDEAIDKFNIAKRKVLLLREGIKKDQKLLADFYKEREKVAEAKLELKQLTTEKEQLILKLNGVKTELDSNEKETLEQEEEIKYIKGHTSFFKESEESQNACPWTFDEFDMAREEWSLQLQSKENRYHRRNYCL